MSDNGLLILECFLAFLLGSIPFAWIIAKFKGIDDLRNHGSKNVGTTNVVRTAGWFAGMATFVLDFLKGTVCFYLPQWFDGPFYEDRLTLGLFLGFLAMLGHCYSPFLKFKGGKGVATTMGMVLAFKPGLGIALMLIYSLGLAFTRMSALGSYYGMLFLILSAFFFPFSLSQTLILVVTALFVLSKHQNNWKNILQKTVLFIFLINVPSFAIENDFDGTKLDFSSQPKRIVALMPSLAEILAGLGHEDKLVGIPEFTELKINARVLGPYHRISPEAVYAQNPDLVLANRDGNSKELVKALKKLGLKVVVLNTTSLQDIATSMKIMQSLLNGADKNILIQKFESTFINKEKPVSNHKKIFTVIGWNPLVTVGKNNFINELIEHTGAENIFADQKAAYPRPSIEQVIHRNPDIILICDLTNEKNEDLLKMSEYWKTFKNISAVKNNKIIIVNGSLLLKPGFRLIDGYEFLNKIL